jgi:hypothetical protein
VKIAQPFKVGLKRPGAASKKAMRYADVLEKEKRNQVTP